MIVTAKAPLRISYCGGGTDFEPWYRRHGGKVLSSAIKLYAHAEFTHGEDDKRLRYWADTKPGSGLGASSAVSVATIAAVDAAHGIERSPYQIAESAWHLERQHLRQAGGRQDYYPAAFGGTNLIEFEQDGTVRVNPVPLSEEVQSLFESVMLLVHTGRHRNGCTHAVQQVNAERLVRDCENDEIVKTSLRLTSELVEPMRRAMASGDLPSFRTCMAQAWQFKKHTGAGHDPQVEAIIEAGGGCGKLCGSGGGGHVLLVCNPDDVQLTKNNLQAFGYDPLPVRFESAGVKVTTSRSDQWTT